MSETITYLGMPESYWWRIREAIQKARLGTIEEVEAKLLSTPPKYYGVEQVRDGKWAIYEKRALLEKYTIGWGVTREDAEQIAVQLSRAVTYEPLK